MKLSRLNLLSALVSFTLGWILLAMGQSWSGIVWLICSLVWLCLSVAQRGASISEPNPARRLARRLSRLLIWS
jgi:hypothetical protein